MVLKMKISICVFPFNISQLLAINAAYDSLEAELRRTFQKSGKQLNELVKSSTKADGIELVCIIDALNKLIPSRDEVSTWTAMSWVTFKILVIQ